MKKVLLAGVVLAAVGLAIAQDKPQFKSDDEKASYMYGLDLGRALKKQGFDINPDLFVKGFKESLAGKEVPYTDDEIRQTMMAFQTGARDRATKKNKKDGADFLAANKKKEGVKVLPATADDGKTYELQYKVLKEGTGATPKATDTVKAHYKGTFLDGKEFDSSYSRGEPLEIPVGGVIKGWTAALQSMKVGSKWQLFIPSDLAYGDQGNRAIPPGSTLLFEVELLGVK